MYIYTNLNAYDVTRWYNLMGQLSIADQNIVIEHMTVYSKKMYITSMKYIYVLKMYM
jgi:hypothetical protein